MIWKFLIFQSGEGEIWGNIGNKIRNNNGSLIVHKDKDNAYGLEIYKDNDKSNFFLAWLYTKFENQQLFLSLLKLVEVEYAQNTELSQNQEMIRKSLSACFLFGALDHLYN